MGGCALQPPITRDYAGPVAVVEESALRTDSGKAAMFFIRKIDGRRILNSEIRSLSASQGRGNNLTIVTKPYDVPAEKHVFTVVGSYVWAMDGRGLFEASRAVTGDLEFVPQAGHTYLVKGSLSKQVSTVWVEDKDTGQIIGKYEKPNP